MNPLPDDYAERVYAGVLGKIIGVYLGRPVEGWTHERIQRELGDVAYYVHDRLGVPLVVTDDDIAGTFTFLRALPDHGDAADLTPAQIGRTWLDYLIENRTVLWWGGLGMSTEHTAYLRLKHGIAAPASGSAATNGTVVAEQIGAQIFIDGWAMVAAGRPELAAGLARRAASVSHDGEAVHAAALLAAMEAHAFVESDIDALLDRGLSVIPPDSAVATMIGAIRAWHAAEPSWRAARERLDAEYGYHRYGGNCHVMPNHGLIVLSLLYGGGDFDRSMRIVNTSGWDTDCNSGNLGCLLGLRGGLAAFDGADWRGPVADRLYLPTADGGRCISDAVRETAAIVASGLALAGLPPSRPKDGARYGFAFPGSVQGFAVTAGDGRVGHVAGALAVRADGGEVVATTDTFIPPEYPVDDGYGFVASPALYPGQTVWADVRRLGDAPVAARIAVRHYTVDDEVVTLPSPSTTLGPGGWTRLSWTVPDTGGLPVAAVGIAVTAGAVLLDRLDWTGEPAFTLRPLSGPGTMWRRAWVDALDHVRPAGPAPFTLIQNEGTGLRLIGAQEWADYRVTATLTPGLTASFGVVARVRGLRRHYAVVVDRAGRLRLVRRLYDEAAVLAERRLDWPMERTHSLALDVAGSTLTALIDGVPVLTADDDALPSGAAGLLCEEGLVEAADVVIGPVGS
ncbi:ADP-ribosylglycohydrolase family protein [Jiangella alkaliphila]|uniref:ADP-ribosylglycohydrolase n=1 Tax=Jiangella alkaliphila TaxID=419479 RepID=A0A1H2LWD3_9ACTN|nr:ADP-ribosylglycohydrolase family protein [Jiangella alkaliphila]SDU85184.1 ADP-ribosylglycohydrolase [Jiangella alkaliphila]